MRVAGKSLGTGLAEWLLFRRAGEGSSTDEHNTRESAYRPILTADGALKAATVFWFVVMVVGQVIFAVSTAMFYSFTALRGDYHVWNKHLAHGVVEGDPAGNFALVVHIVAAVLITLCGAIQFIPRIRRSAPGFHRWNGRIYISTAFIVSLAGLYMQVFRGTPTSIAQQFGQGLLAVLIMLCAGLALRYALKRDFAAHRRWALRLFVLASGALFIRSSVTLTAMLLAGTGSLDISTVQGPILTYLTYAQYFFPLAVLEAYFWTQSRPGSAARMIMAARTCGLTLLMGAGIAAASIGIFLPSMRSAVDGRPSIAETLASTIASGGVDAAIQQYHRLQIMQPKLYNFDEDELNVLGYDLIRAHKYADAIRILQLNTEVYPKSANTWDSLGEAYMDAGDVQPAVANYQKSLAMNPANRNAVIMLQKLHAR